MPAEDAELEEVREKKRFFIDLKWYDERNRSFKVMAQARFCRQCQDKIGTETQERVPTFNPQTGRVVYEMRAVPYGSSPLSVIRNCCSKTRGYITLDTPLLEAIFRVFLANGNQPADVDGIREQMSEWIPLSGRPHNYDPEVIEKALQGDNYYGLREFKIE
ncbi:MAG: hypothetical protein M1274_15840 [Actinobacteria bacterium]|nr:hypothetical protein [Actinomycetota bacterium]